MGGVPHAGSQQVRERAVTARQDPQLLRHMWLIPGCVLLPVVLKLRQSTVTHTILLDVSSCQS